jgi:hypothetical protein
MRKKEGGVKKKKALVAIRHGWPQKPVPWISQNLADAPFARNEVFGAIVVRFMAVRAFKGADVRVGDERICALAGHTLAPQYRKSLQTGFAFYEPDQSHRSASLTDRIFQFDSGA